MFSYKFIIPHREWVLYEFEKEDIVKHNIYMYVNHKTMKDQIRNSSIHFNPDNMQLPDGASSIITL